jgi:hypothetical protein
VVVDEELNCLPGTCLGRRQMLRGRGQTDTCTCKGARVRHTSQTAVGMRGEGRWRQPP